MSPWQTRCSSSRKFEELAYGHTYFKLKRRLILHSKLVKSSFIWWKMLLKWQSISLLCITLDYCFLLHPETTLKPFKRPHTTCLASTLWNYYFPLTLIPLQLYCSPWITGIPQLLVLIVSSVWNTFPVVYIAGSFANLNSLCKLCFLNQVFLTHSFNRNPHPTIHILPFFAEFFSKVTATT